MAKQPYPEKLVTGAITLDFAVCVYTTLFFISAWSKDFQCYFVTDIFDKTYHTAHVMHKLSLITSIIATFLGWFSATIITVYTYEALNSLSYKVSDPYGIARMTPCLAFTSAFFLGLTVYLFGNFRTSSCSSLVVITIVFLIIGAYFLLRHFESEKPVAPAGSPRPSASRIRSQPQHIIDLHEGNSLVFSSRI